MILFLDEQHWTAQSGESLPSPNTNANPNLSPNTNPSPNFSPNTNPSPNPNPNRSPNPNPSPNPNACIILTLTLAVVLTQALTLALTLASAWPSAGCLEQVQPKLEDGKVVSLRAQILMSYLA